MKTLNINFQPPYPIIIGNNFLTDEFLRNCFFNSRKKIALFTNSKLADLFGTKIQSLMNCELFLFPEGEQNKNREVKESLEDQLFEKKYGRDSCFIALGGGVVTDLVGFVASTYCRGVDCIYIPTTLLSMVDASIGGKTGVNTKWGKNLIGTIYQPKAVYSDISFLLTLPDSEWENGLVEILKHALIYDHKFFVTLEQNVSKIQNRDPEFLIDIIFRSCQIKKIVVEQDERELGIREILNFGHTIGHAVEALENYSMGHGRAVAIGIIVESYMAKQLGILEQDIFAQIIQIFTNFKMVLKTNIFSQKEKVKELLQLDKKAKSSKAHFVFISSIGKIYTKENKYSTEVSEQILNDALIWAEDYFKC